VAVHPSPRQTVIAGRERVDAVIAVVRAERFARSSREVPRITALMDPILPQLRMELSDRAQNADDSVYLHRGGHCGVRAGVRCRLLGG
jgi:acyl transferase domain-containing protein